MMLSCKSKNNAEPNLNRQLEVQSDVIGSQQRQDNMLAFDPLQVMNPNQISAKENQVAEESPRILSLPSPQLQSEFKNIPGTTWS